MKNAETVPPLDQTSSFIHSYTMLLSQVQRPLTSQDKRQGPEKPREWDFLSPLRDVLFELCGVMYELTSSYINVYIIHICNQGCNRSLHAIVICTSEPRSSYWRGLEYVFFRFSSPSVFILWLVLILPIRFLVNPMEGCTQLWGLFLLVCVFSRWLWWLADAIRLEEVQTQESQVATATDVPGSLSLLTAVRLALSIFWILKIKSWSFSYVT